MASVNTHCFEVEGMLAAAPYSETELESVVSPVVTSSPGRQRGHEGVH